MLTIFKHEIKLLYKSFLIWTLSVGGMCFVCILLFNSMKDTMSGMAESFSQMGAFADAFAAATTDAAATTSITEIQKQIKTGMVRPSRFHFRYFAHLFS